MVNIKFYCTCYHALEGTSQLWDSFQRYGEHANHRSYIVSDLFTLFGKVRPFIYYSSISSHQPCANRRVTFIWYIWRKGRCNPFHSYDTIGWNLNVMITYRHFKHFSNKYCDTLKSSCVFPCHYMADKLSNLHIPSKYTVFLQSTLSIK